MNTRRLLFVGLVGLLLLGAGCGESSSNQANKTKVSKTDSGENLDVPFTSQAPEGMWYEPWLNACEETSIFMIDAFYSGEEDITTEEAKENIRSIFSQKTEEIEPSLDESAETIVEIVNLLDLDWKARVVNQPSENDLALEIENGNPVIVPVYAPELDNPYYTAGGPDYHVMVLTGYDAVSQEFIVNDPGTRYGDELRFSYDVLMDAIHNLNQSDYDAGAKKVVFTTRN